MYDVIIIGGGPAAISAGIYTSRKKLKTLLISKSWGGQIASASFVENYPGFQSILGMELTNKMVEHLKKNELEIKNAEATKVEIDQDTIKVTIGKNIFEAKTLIVATGRSPKKLGFPDEDKYIGKGISYCATCDGPLYGGKEVAVVGAGNAGTSMALELARHASKVYLLASREKADGFYCDQVDKTENIEVIGNVRATGFKGDEFVTSIIYTHKQTGQETDLPVEGIFAAIGSNSNSSLVENLVKLNEWKEIEIDPKNRTSQANIFAAGDVTNVVYKQVIIATGEGAKAALSAYEYVSGIEEKK